MVINVYPVQAFLLQQQLLAIASVPRIPLSALIQLLLYVEVPLAEMSNAITQHHALKEIQPIQSHVIGEDGRSSLLINSDRF